jgi:hypothetical protein
MATLEQTWARPPTPQVVWVYQIHAAGGVGDSTTMVVMVVFDVCLGCICGLFWSSSIITCCRHVSKNNPLRWGYMRYKVGHPDLPHTYTGSRWTPPLGDYSRQQCNVSILLAILMVIAVCRYYTARINRWRRFMASLKSH